MKWWCRLSSPSGEAEVGQSSPGEAQEGHQTWMQRGLCAVNHREESCMLRLVQPRPERQNEAHRLSPAGWQGQFAVFLLLSFCCQNENNEGQLRSKVAQYFEVLFTIIFRLCVTIQQSVGFPPREGHGVIGALLIHVHRCWSRCSEIWRQEQSEKSSLTNKPQKRTRNQPQSWVCFRTQVLFRLSLNLKLLFLRRSYWTLSKRAIQSVTTVTGPVN